MTITGKEEDIQRAVNKLYDGNEIKVRIIDPKQLKETNTFLRNVLQNIISLRA